MAESDDGDSVAAPPVRGEVWDVDLEPAEPGELDKTRPVLVINAMLFDRLDTRVVVPLTAWRGGFDEKPTRSSFVRPGGTAWGAIPRRTRRGFARCRPVASRGGGGR